VDVAIDEAREQIAAAAIDDEGAGRDFKPSPEGSDPAIDAEDVGLRLEAPEGVVPGVAVAEEEVGWHGAIVGPAALTAIRAPARAAVASRG
jgi:hypothetical protein